MAFYKNREVRLVRREYPQNDVPNFRIEDVQTMDEQVVKFEQIKFTAKERTDLEKQGYIINDAQLIQDKDAQEIKDSQDVDKIKAKQEKDAKQSEQQAKK